MNRCLFIDQWATLGRGLQDEVCERHRGGWQRPLAILLALVLLIETGYLIFGRGEFTGLIQPAAADYASPQAIGETLFTDFLLPFEVTSVLLLVAMVGVIVLTKEERKKLS